MYHPHRPRHIKHTSGASTYKKVKLSPWQGVKAHRSVSCEERISSAHKKTNATVERCQCVRLITSSPSVNAMSRQCGILNILQAYRPPRAVTGIPLLFNNSIQFNSLLFMCRVNSHKANYRHSTVQITT
jgi:hypothetical protein